MPNPKTEPLKEGLQSIWKNVCKDQSDDEQYEFLKEPIKITSGELGNKKYKN